MKAPQDVKGKNNPRVLLKVQLVRTMNMCIDLARTTMMGEHRSVTDAKELAMEIGTKRKMVNGWRKFFVFAAS